MDGRSILYQIDLDYEIINFLLKNGLDPQLVESTYCIDKNDPIYKLLLKYGLKK